MGNIFSYFFNNSNPEYNDNLMELLNEDIQYASHLDIETINSQVGILEETTQSSLKNISKDVKYLFEEFEIVKSKLDKCENICKQAYLNSMTKNSESSIYNQNSVYFDPYNENNDIENNDNENNDSENEDIY